MRMLGVILILVASAQAFVDDMDIVIVDVCNLPKKVGPCKALIPRFYYDKKLKKCEAFNYGGCQGNANNFRSKKECKRTCMS